MTRFLLVLLLTAPAMTATAQKIDLLNRRGGEDARFHDGKPNVFLDCRRCDESHIRREITFVNYVRERERAAVHVLLTDEQTGGGGREYTFHVIGQGPFRGRDYTLTHTARASDTWDEQRTGVARTLKIAFVPYLMDTPIVQRMTVSVEEGGDTALAREDDPWKGWTIQIYGDGFGDMEAKQYSLHVRYGISIDRVTEEWKVRLRPYFNYSVDQFKSDGETIRSESRRDGFDSYAIKSISDHWSLGLFGDVFTSTFHNVDLRLRGSPAVEYSVFPYRESSRRKLTFAYRIGLSHVQYRDTTIFNQISELLPGHAFDAEYDVTQPWGSIDVGLEASQYLNELSNYRVELDAGVSVRLTRGLSLRFGGEFDFIHDQLNLRRGDAPLEEVLLRRRQLATDFHASGSVGFTYRFGSIYANVVNTRF